MEFKSIAILADEHTPAQDAYKNLKSIYENVSPEEADIIIALGGDGFMLSVIHQFMRQGKPIYGMNLGTVGFLMNEYDDTVTW